ncbi:hypothetical protein AAFF_G00120770 [Aldrovandia affinis]|uniref:Uncharacterized protein n=1 Tax=Aldrovandia affinis TaxID=143900 RepID=A0AAD7WB17_9TELE|nr:hypothetical protein AAFF_G00120770 [Aldrovandia affinis]
MCGQCQEQGPCCVGPVTWTPSIHRRGPGQPQLGRWTPDAASGGDIKAGVVPLNPRGAAIVAVMSSLCRVLPSPRRPDDRLLERRTPRLSGSCQLGSP